LNRLVIAGLVALAIAAPTLAQEPYVPPDLEPWRSWVLHGQEWRACVMRFDGTSERRDDRYCAWPGTLTIDVDANGASFRQQWTVTGEDTYVGLPGARNHWPENVTRNGAAALVLSADGVPAIQLPPGQHTLRGELQWDERPGELVVPGQVGLVALSIDGRRVLVPDLEGNTLFLGQRREEAVARDAVTATVYRLVADGVPTRLSTWIRLRVSGALREERFSAVLPEGFVPEILYGDLPARLEADGELLVQLRPGEWNIRLTARAPGVVDELSLPVGGRNLPDEAVLSFQSNDRLRIALPGGLPPVDPVQADVPAVWRGLPAFRLSAGATLVLEERSRGLVENDNQLALSRTLWLDFDGTGYTAHDHITGSLRRDWRLDMQAPYSLEAAAVDGQPALITRRDGAPDGGPRGVELRQPALNLQATARVEAGGAMPVSGWLSRFTAVSAELRLPPGYRLLAATRTDSASGAWLGRWQLLDIFLLLVISAATWKLFGRVAGVIAFAALGLSFHEVGAPSWLWLNLLVATALLRVAPAGRLQTATRAYFYLGLAALALVLVPFAAGEVRSALYPQLDRGMFFAGAGAVARVPSAASEFEAGMFEKETRQQRSVADVAAGIALEPVEEIVVTANALPDRAAPIRSFERFPPGSLVQAGPGLPGWRWQNHRLGWSGPVVEGQDFRLIIVSPLLMAVWRIAAVLLVVFFTAYFVAEALRRRIALPGGLSIGTHTPMIVIAVVASAFGFHATSAEADYPDARLLEQLRQRLTEPADCEPRCAELVAARVTIDRESLFIDLDVHAAAAVAVPVLSLAGDWQPARITVDGSPVNGAVRDGDRLLVPVDAGQQALRLTGPVPDQASIVVDFPEPPRIVDVDARDWSVAGVAGRRLLTGSLQFDRLREADADDASKPVWESSRFPVFVTVSRRFELGLDWQVVTTVQRVAPESGALEVQVPLVPGESVLTDELEIENDIVQVAMAANESSMSWTSSLAPTGELLLEAGDGREYVETLQVMAGSIWHVAFSGVPESVPATQIANARVAEFHPRPGETLRMTASRPAGAGGGTLAIDNVAVAGSVGQRLVEATLDFTYRATQGSSHIIALPAEAELTRVTIDNRSEALRLVDNTLTLPIVPGSHHVSVGFRVTGDHGFRADSPGIDLAAPAANITTSLSPPANRWLLLTSGPTLGPAVLYWPELIVLIGLALILGRTGLAPLKARDWLLLSLGFSMFSWPVLALVVVWLLATAARERWSLKLERWVFNTRQVLYAILTIAALFAILVSLPMGLLGSPDMHITGNGSYAGGLKWFSDLSSGPLPVASYVSVPLWAYKVLILFWALWLSFALVAWLPWVWRVFVADGLWRSRRQEALQSGQ
jgi:hypothetical protein